MSGKDSSEKDRLFDEHRIEQLVWQARNSSPAERLALAEEMLELMYAAGYDYHAQKALLDKDYNKRRGL